MKKNVISVAPDKRFGLQRDFTKKFSDAYLRDNDLFFHTLEATLKASQGQAETFVKEVLGRNLVDSFAAKFGPAIADFKIIAPKDYDHKKQLANFSKKYKKKFYYFNENITDRNFAGVSNQLAPGKEYGEKIFPILTVVSSEECLGFLKSQNALLVGAQGESLIYELEKEKFPVSRFTLSFDEKEKLWVDADGYRRVPLVDRYSDDASLFHLGYLEGDWIDFYCLLCVCELN